MRKNSEEIYKILGDILKNSGLPYGFDKTLYNIPGRGYVSDKKDFDSYELEKNKNTLNKVIENLLTKLYQVEEIIRNHPHPEAEEVWLAEKERLEQSLNNFEEINKKLIYKAK